MSSKPELFEKDTVDSQVDILDYTVSYNDTTMFGIDIEDTTPDPDSNIIRCRNVKVFI